MSYTIVIDESQRQLIELALKHLPFAATSDVEVASHYISKEQQLLVLAEMFEELKGTHSDVINGFCL
ncbi:hypothetical protein D3C80_670760 [compost metagenome]|jgi:hypothetical protein